MDGPRGLLLLALKEDFAAAVLRFQLVDLELFGNELLGADQKDRAGERRSRRRGGAVDDIEDLVLAGLLFGFTRLGRNQIIGVDEIR